MKSDEEHDKAFNEALAPLIPHMRAFARSLCGNTAMADDLTQEALAKAWMARPSFELGTNMKAWLFMILRNQFLSDKRRAWRWTGLDQDTAERTLVAVSNPSACLELDEVRRAVAMLPDDQREALILIGAGGLSYEEASEICRAPIGTIKSRVSRGRNRIVQILANGSMGQDSIAPSSAMADILRQVEQLSSARAA
jgi:RNA polymerase sigma-70 factor, ECF subfamily